MHLGRGPRFENKVPTQVVKYENVETLYLGGCVFISIYCPKACGYDKLGYPVLCSDQLRVSEVESFKFSM